jgi:hypothetical protein
VKKVEQSRKGYAMQLLAESMMMYPYTNPYGGGQRRRNELDSIDIVSEYGLICQKKSNLSKRQRDAIEFQFNRKYRAI